MKIVLVNPPMDLDIAMGKIKNVMRLYTAVPLGLAYIAAYIRESGFPDVEVVDAYAEALSVDETVRRCVEKKADVLGITCVTATYHISCEIADKFKALRPVSTVVFGGEHPTVAPESTLSNASVDIAVRGEGERTFLELLEWLRDGAARPVSVKGVSYRDGDSVLNNPGRELIGDLDTLPLPAYDLFPMHLYDAPPHWAIRSPALQIIASRGCPYRCVFCSLGVMGKERRVRSPGDVIREIRLLVEKYGARQIMFVDANFPISRKEGMRFCGELIKEGLHKRIVWTTECHVNVMDEELARMMSRSGCRMICFGIESGDQGILDGVRKGIRIETARSAVDAAHKAGIRIKASYILGLPGETKGSCLRTLGFARELDTAFAQFNLIVPYPGTPVFEDAVREDPRIVEEWDKFLQASTFGEYAPVYAPAGLDRMWLKKFAKKAYREYYLRPGMLLKHLKYVRTPADAARYMRVGRALISGTL